MLMGRSPNHKKARMFATKSEAVVRCGRQFPDCPAEPNEQDCRICPFYKK